MTTAGTLINGCGAIVHDEFSEPQKPSCPAIGRDRFDVHVNVTKQLLRGPGLRIGLDIDFLDS